MVGMPPTPRLPIQLASRPFRLEEALRAGLSRAQLLGAGWRRLGHKVYARKEIADEPLARLEAAMRRLPADAVFSGRTAAFLHGLETSLPIAIEATLPATARTTHLAGITIRRRQIGAHEVATRQGFRVTSALHTVTDLASHLELVEAVAVLDAALHKGLVGIEELKGSIHERQGQKGTARLRRALDHAEPATESPMETRLRMLLVLAGLPKPEVQVPLYDESGAFVGRADLYYPDQRLVIEYDGSTHRDSVAADNKRQNRLIDAAYNILRFTASNLASSVGLVRRALHL